MADTPPIGPRLREARRRQDLSLAALAERLGVTKGFLSQVERDLTAPSVGTLLRLCSALDLPVGHLFDGPPTPLVRSGERAPIAFGGSGVSEFRLTPAGETRAMLLLSEIAPGGGSGEERYSLGSEAEIAHVIDGSLHLEVAGTRHWLSAGDTLTFDASSPHRWHNPSAAMPARVLWFLVPALD